MRTLVMAVRNAHAEDVESESVVIDTDSLGAVVLELDDGTRLALDEEELRAALKHRAA